MEIPGLVHLSKKFKLLAKTEDWQFLLWLLFLRIFCSKQFQYSFSEFPSPNPLLLQNKEFGFDTAAAAAKSIQSCLTVWPHRQQPTRLPHPWDSPGKNTGVGCHFLLQCMKVKREREVAQSCPTLHDPMDYSLPGSSIHGICQARVLEWGAIAFSGFDSNLSQF